MDTNRSVVMRQSSKVKTLILNNMSPGMLSRIDQSVHMTPLSRQEASTIVRLAEDVVCMVGRPNVAQIFTQELGFPVVSVKAYVRMDGNTRAVVGHYKGRHLTDSDATLPNNAKIEWWLVYLD
jgi:hypothetical protein